LGNQSPNKKLKRTKYAVIFFAKTRKKTAIKFSRLAKRYMQVKIEMKACSVALFGEAVLGCVLSAR
jgi:hypothetical protein